MITKASISDVNEMVKIHIHEFAGDFLPNLGADFLNTLYKDFLADKESILLVSKNSDVKGFIMGAVNFPTLFKKIILNNLIAYSYLLTKAIFKNPLLIRNVVNSLFYTKKTNKFHIPAELVVICVAKKFQNKNIGSTLVKQLDKEFKKRDIKKYKVSTTKSNKISNNFYIKNNFKLISNFILFKEFWNLYSKKI